MSQQRLLFLSFCLTLGFGFTAWGAGSSGHQVRAPAVAGRFYEAREEDLRKAVQGYLAEYAGDNLEDTVLGLMAPHAGYVFSGRTAAAAYARVTGKPCELVILLGNAHRAPVQGLAIDAHHQWRTPLGTVEVDTELARELSAADPLFRLDAAAHAGDHVLEVQLPFLQETLKAGFRILPILFGPGIDADRARRRLAAELPARLRGREVLIVVSADLTHYPAERDSRRVDTGFLETLERFDPEALQHYVAHRMAEGVPDMVCVTCSESAILAGMDLTRNLGAREARILAYSNSADSPYGDRHRVVGYGAAAFVRATTPEGEQEAMAEVGLGSEARQLLLQLAREAVQQAVRGKKPPAFEPSLPVLQEPRGAFVTLKKKGQLRGCIGYIQPIQPLWRSVRDNATSAALRDPRFPAVKPSELADLHIEISVLSPLENVEDPQEIQLGLHGIQIHLGNHRAVFLPQVAPEQGWNLNQTLQALCRKAGLSLGAWKSPHMQFQVFTAEVFQEPLPRAGSEGARKDAAFHPGR